MPDNTEHSIPPLLTSEPSSSLTLTFYLTLTLIPLLLTAAAYFLHSTTTQYRLLSHIPGPHPTTGISNLWLLRTVLSGDAHLRFYDAQIRTASTIATASQASSSSLPSSPSSSSSSSSHVPPTPTPPALTRLGPRDLVTSDPELLRRTLGVRTRYRRADSYAALRLGVDVGGDRDEEGEVKRGKENILSERDEGLHGRLRSVMGVGYRRGGGDGGGGGGGGDSGEMMMEEKVDCGVKGLIRLVGGYAAGDDGHDEDEDRDQDQAGDGVGDNEKDRTGAEKKNARYHSGRRRRRDISKPFDLARKVQYFTLDVISDLAFGKPFGDLERDEDVHGFIAAVEVGMPGVMLATVVPWILPILGSLPKRVKRWLGVPCEGDERGLGRTMSIAKQVAAERFGPNKKVQNDMLGSFIARGLTQSEAESEILAMILAGSDTTATALRVTLLHLITNPRVLARLRAEIDEHHHHHHHHRRPSPPDAISTTSTSPQPIMVITDAQTQQLPYLQAVINESIRIHPPIVGLLPKEVPPGGDTFKGVFIPAGTRIGYGAWGLFRRHDIWGDDADEFRPERWLLLPPSDHRGKNEWEEEAKRLKQMRGALDLAFSYGRWQCLGHGLATMELGKAIAELVSRFDMALAEPTGPNWKSRSFGLFAQSEFWVRAHHRRRSSLEGRR